MILKTLKAFDQVWVDGLFYKMKNYGMDPKLWRILHDAYDNFQCNVLLAGETSRCFLPQQGIHQGDVWSMPLYCLFNNAMIKELRSSLHGVSLRGIKCTCPTFVDDLSILAWSKIALNCLLAIANKHSKLWRFLFGPDKSFSLIFGKDCFPNDSVVLGNNVIKVSDTHTHVGIPLCTSASSEKRAIQERVSSCRQTLFTVRALSPVPLMLHPYPMSKLYWSLCVPRMTYGIEVWPVGQAGISAMTRAHNQSAKVIQGLPPQTSDPVCHSTLGWKTMEAHVDLCVLMFLWKLLALPVNCIYNTLVIDRLTEFRFHNDVPRLHSPIYNMYRTSIKYGLGNAVHDMLDSGDVGTRSQWFTLVNNAIKEYLTAKWFMTVMMYKRLNTFLLYVPEPHFVQWWNVCKLNQRLTMKCKTLIALLVGEHSLGCGQSKYVYRTALCQLCDSYIEETIPHFLLECSGLETARTPLLARLRDEMPAGMIYSFDSMCSKNQTKFLLAEMGRTPIQEWSGIQTAIIELVHDLYCERQSKLMA